jgi:F0F1-type ATP synthase epsilon subunit
MTAPAYNIRIVTPQGIAHKGLTTHTLVPVETGFVGILADHAPYLVSSKGGKLTVRETSGVERTFTVGPGFFEVNNNEAVFLTQNCASA